MKTSANSVRGAQAKSLAALPITDKVAQASLVGPARVHHPLLLRRHSQHRRRSALQVEGVVLLGVSERARATALDLDALVQRRRAGTNPAEIQVSVRGDRRPVVREDLARTRDPWTGGVVDGRKRRNEL